MKMEFKLLFSDAAKRKAELDIYDVIGDPWTGVSSQSVLWQLRSLDIDELTVRVNSLGGVVTEGFDIYNLLREHPAPRKVTRISGTAASIATVIALACPVVEMYENSTFMIHDPYASPDPFMPLREKDLIRSADLLKLMRGQMLKIYADKTGRDLAELEKLCADETWMGPEQAKELGFVDKIIKGGDRDMLTTDIGRASARAWGAESKKIFALYSKLPQTIRIAAQAAVRSEPSAPPAPEANPRKKPMARRKINKIALGSSRKHHSALATIVALSASLRSIKAEEITDEELDAMRSELEEAKTLAEEKEKELEESSAKAEEYESLKAELEESKSRSAKAEKDLEELKKTMEGLKGTGDEDEQALASDEDDKEKEARAQLRGAGKRALYRVARAAADAVGTYDPEKLEGALIARGLKGGLNPQAEREARVSKMIAEGRLPPARKAWAMAASAVALDAFEEALGGQPILPRHNPGDAHAQYRHEHTPGANVGSRGQGVDAKGRLIPEGRVLANGLTDNEEKIRMQSGLTVEQALEARALAN